jgi:hypothetical protein
MIGLFLVSALATLAEGRGATPGSRATSHDGKEYVFVKASGAIAKNGVVSIDASSTAAALSTANDAFGNIVGVAPYAFADGEYGWVLVRGVCDVLVGAACAANAQLNTTATGGQLDDDATLGAFRVSGIVLSAAQGAAAGPAVALVNFPSVGAVI